MASTTDTREKYWRHWVSYVAPLGLDPFLQGTIYEYRARALSGFAARVRAGHYGRGRTVRAGTVTAAITAVGKKISMAKGCNPTKIEHSDRLIPRLAQMLDGMHKQDPPTVKKLPVEVDVPEFLSAVGQRSQANDLDQAIGDLALIAFYYLLRVGEYTLKNARNNTNRQCSSA